MGNNEINRTPDSRLKDSKDSGIKDSGIKDSEDRIKSLILIQENSRKALLAHRALDRIIQSEEFDDAYMKDPSGFRPDFNLKQLKAWIGSRKSELENLSYRTLRERAKNENIPLWSRLSKEELVNEIQSLSSGKTAGGSQTVPPKS